MLSSLAVVCGCSRSANLLSRPSGQLWIALLVYQNQPIFVQRGQFLRDLERTAETLVQIARRIRLRRAVARGNVRAAP